MSCKFVSLSPVWASGDRRARITLQTFSISGLIHILVGPSAIKYKLSSLSLHVHMVPCSDITDDVGKHLWSISPVAMAPTKFVDVGPKGSLGNTNHCLQLSLAVSPIIFDMICAERERWPFDSYTEMSIFLVFSSFWLCLCTFCTAKCIQTRQKKMKSPGRCSDLLI